MKFSTPILAKDLKKELTSFGVKVVRCSQANQNALITINSDAKNVELFLSFCNLNDYAGVCALPFKAKTSTNSYVDYGNIFKYIEVC